MLNATSRTDGGEINGCCKSHRNGLTRPNVVTAICAQGKIVEFRLKSSGLSHQGVSTPAQIPPRSAKIWLKSVQLRLISAKHVWTRPSSRIGPTAGRVRRARTSTPGSRPSPDANPKQRRAVAGVEQRVLSRTWCRVRLSIGLFVVARTGRCMRANRQMLLLALWRVRGDSGGGLGASLRKAHECLRQHPGFRVICSRGQYYLSSRCVWRLGWCRFMHPKSFVFRWCGRRSVVRRPEAIYQRWVWSRFGRRSRSFLSSPLVKSRSLQARSVVVMVLSLWPPCPPLTVTAGGRCGGRDCWVVCL